MGDINAAYRKGQEDMRRRIARQWGGWFVSGLGSLMAGAQNLSPVANRSVKGARVDVQIRRTKIEDMQP